MVYRSGLKFERKPRQWEKSCKGLERGHIAAGNVGQAEGERAESQKMKVVMCGKVNVMLWRGGARCFMEQLVAREEVFKKTPFFKRGEKL